MQHAPVSTVFGDIDAVPSPRTGVLVCVTVCVTVGVTVSVTVEVIVCVTVPVAVCVTVGLGAMTDTVGQPFISKGSSVGSPEAKVSDFTTKFAVPTLACASAPGVPPPYVTVMVPVVAARSYTFTTMSQVL